MKIILKELVNQQNYTFLKPNTFYVVTNETFCD